MASQEPPRRPPLAGRRTPTLTTIRDIGDDLLLEIFLRLPSLPSLVRAALACRAFLAAVRSSPAFRRRFLALHGPPLLGVFFDPGLTDVRSYAPLRRRSDPDFGAAVRGSDFLLTGIPDILACGGWNIMDCRGGYVLLLNWSTKRMAAYNPLTGALEVFPGPPDEIRDCRNRSFLYNLIPSGEAAGSFRVVFLCPVMSRTRAAVLASGTREWQILSCTSGNAGADQHWLRTAAPVSRSMYWSQGRQAYKLVLDTATLHVSSLDLPEQLKGQDHSYKAGQTSDGKLCIVSAAEFTLSIWFRGADVNGVERWMLDSAIPLEGEVLRATESSREDHQALEVFAVLDGIVYLRSLASWLMSYSLDTGKLEKLFNRRFHRCFCPYIMAWPPSLVGNNNMNP